MLWKVFAGEMSFGELSLIKSQSHLRSHIRKDQFSYSWNCSWPLLPWALIQNQQHGHRGLKQLNWVRLQEASKSTEGKYPIKHCQLALSGVSLSFLVSSWVTYSFLYDLNVNDKGVIQQWTMQKKKKRKECSCQNNNLCPAQTPARVIKNRHGKYWTYRRWKPSKAGWGEVDKSGPINQKQQPVLKSGCLPPMSVKKQR